MVKVHITRTSSWTWDGEIKKYKDWNEAIPALLAMHDKLIIEPPFNKAKNKCDYEVELYDDWRE